MSLIGLIMIIIIFMIIMIMTIILCGPNLGYFPVKYFRNISNWRLDLWVGMLMQVRQPCYNCDTTVFLEIGAKFLQKFLLNMTVVVHLRWPEPSSDLSIFVFLNFCICVDYQPTECVCGLCCHAGSWQGSFSGPQIQRE